MKKKVDTAIILINYDSLDDTRACIESLNNSNNSNHFIIVVDNCSEEKISVLDKEENLKLIENSENLGFAKANNIGINWANENLDFRYVLIINNDTIVNVDTIQKLQESFKIDSKIGITTGKIFYYDQPEIVWFGGGSINKSRGWPSIIDFNSNPSENGASKSKLVQFASGCLMMFNKESITNLKGFDERFFMYCEDLELCLRAEEKGISIYYNSEAVIYHKVQGGSNIKGMVHKNPNLKFLMLNMKVNQYKTMNDHLKSFQRIKFKFIFHIELLLKSIYFYLKGRSDMFAIYRDVIRGLK